MIILYNDRPDRHVTSWSRHQKTSFPTPGAVRSTLLSIAEQLKKLALRLLRRSITVFINPFLPSKSDELER
jgi:hypothetical protein